MRPDARARIVALAVALALPALAAAPSACAQAVAPAAATPPPGASALDAWAAWRDAEAKTYRLAEDGVRRFSCQVESSLVALLSGPGGPLEGDPPRITLWWRDGECRVTVEGSDKLDATSRARLASLVQPLSDMILPWRPSRGLLAHSFRFLENDPWVRLGERGIEAVARRPGEDPQRSVIAVGPDGLVRRERIERSDGGVSEFEYEHQLKDGRHVLTSTRGTFRGMRVSVKVEWGLQVAGRPLPVRLEIEQEDEEGPLPEGLAKQAFRFSHHQVNGVIPDSVLPPVPVTAAPSLDPGP